MPEELFGGIPDPEPTGDRKTSVRVGVVALLLVGVVFLATPRVVPWSVTGGELQIHARVWSDAFPLGELQLDRARTLDLNQDPGWRPRAKSWGFNGFGFQGGRFKLQNGETVDLYLAAESTAVLIPRRGSVPVMVGVRDPRSFLAALKNAAP
jgi:hypothetical protein